MDKEKGKKQKNKESSPRNDHPSLTGLYYSILCFHAQKYILIIKRHYILFCNLKAQF